MENDFIYDLIRSKEIKDYYMSISLSISEQECIIINCYKSLKTKLELLKKFYKNVSEKNKKDVEELILLYQLINTIYYNPIEFFGNNYNIVYVVHDLVFEYNLTQNKNLIGFFNYYSGSNVYFNTLGETIDYMTQNINLSNLFEIEIILIGKNGEISTPTDFKCCNIDGIFEPIYCTFDKKIFNKYNIQDAIYIYKNQQINHKGLPFEENCKVKFKTPSMKEPFYGIIHNNKDLNGCWYNFVYKDGYLTEEESDLFLDMSYTRIDNISMYSVFDWLERR